MAAAGAGGGGGGAPGQGEEEKRGKEIWNVAAFALMMADPFIEGACVCWLRRALDRWTVGPTTVPNADGQNPLTKNTHSN